MRGFSGGPEPSFTSTACFSLAPRHDLVHQNRKVVGSAQARSRHGFLQHGSILLDIQSDLWENIYVERVDFAGIMSLKEILGRDVKTVHLLTPIRKEFEEVFGVDSDESS